VSNTKGSDLRPKGVSDAKGTEMLKVSLLEHLRD